MKHQDIEIPFKDEKPCYNYLRNIGGHLNSFTYLFIYLFIKQIKRKWNISKDNRIYREVINSNSQNYVYGTSPQIRFLCRAG